MTSPYRVPAHNRFFRAALIPVFRRIFHLLSHVELDGMQHIPTSGPYLLVFNHVSIFDPPLVVSFWPMAPEILGAVDIWSRPGQATIARLYGGIPIHRGEVDRDAMQQALAALQAGYPLMVAPEGGRSHTPGLRQAKPGVVYFLERTGVPVVPVGVVGTTDDFFSRAAQGERPRLEMHVGQPFTLPKVDEPGIHPREIRKQLADYIMRRMAALLPASYRGIYSPITQKTTRSAQAAS